MEKNPDIIPQGEQTNWTLGDDLLRHPFATATNRQNNDDQTLFQAPTTTTTVWAATGSSSGSTRTCTLDSTRPRRLRSRTS